MSHTPAILYYGDDFPGATDTLGTAARAGLRALLFLRLPGAAQLQAAGPLDCVGVAGAARAMNPQEMQAELAPIAELFAQLGARVLHYKLCSTFDSAPKVGSIGTAVHTLRAGLPTRMRTALIGGQPDLGRYCLFGNLYARAGSAGEVFRIDHHPTMSRHPVTPMHEADLRLAPWLLQEAGEPALAQAWDDAAGSDGLLFDVRDKADLQRIGACCGAPRSRCRRCRPSPPRIRRFSPWPAACLPSRRHRSRPRSPSRWHGSIRCRCVRTRPFCSARPRLWPRACRPAAMCWPAPCALASHPPPTQA